MEFNSDRRKAAALVALVFLLGVAFGVAGVLAGRRVLGAGGSTVDRSADRSGNQGGRQTTTQLIRDLRLTPDQERQFRGILNDTRSRYADIRKAMDPQFTEVRARTRDRIRQILTAEQRPLFEDFLRESRNRRNDQNSNNGANDQNNRNNRNDQNGRRNQSTPLVARLTQQLRLTPEQQTQLSGILRDGRASFDTLRQQMNPQFEDVRLKNRERLRQLVTGEQRQVLEAFFQRRDEERRRR
jgi:Spy/CpxP family protein refolding chaperone